MFDHQFNVRDGGMTKGNTSLPFSFCFSIVGYHLGSLQEISHPSTTVSSNLSSTIQHGDIPDRNIPRASEKELPDDLPLVIHIPPVEQTGGEQDPQQEASHANNGGSENTQSQKEEDGEAEIK